MDFNIPTHSEEPTDRDRNLINLGVLYVENVEWNEDAGAYRILFQDSFIIGWMPKELLPELPSTDPSVESHTTPDMAGLGEPLTIFTVTDMRGTPIYHITNNRGMGRGVSVWRSIVEHFRTSIAPIAVVTHCSPNYNTNNISTQLKHHSKDYKIRVAVRMGKVLMMKLDRADELPAGLLMQGLSSSH